MRLNPIRIKVENVDELWVERQEKALLESFPYFHFDDPILEKVVAFSKTVELEVHCGKFFISMSYEIGKMFHSQWLHQDRGQPYEIIARDGKPTLLSIFKRDLPLIEWFTTRNGKCETIRAAGMKTINVKEHSVKIKDFSYFETFLIDGSSIEHFLKKEEAKKILLQYGEKPSKCVPKFSFAKTPE